jgi:hypothetical protein
VLYLFGEQLIGFSIKLFTIFSDDSQCFSRLFQLSVDIGLMWCFSDTILRPFVCRRQLIVLYSVIDKQIRQLLFEEGVCFRLRPGSGSQLCFKRALIFT